jgi:PAS domain S-box-containing protein
MEGAISMDGPLLGITDGGTPEQAIEFLGSILEASTEYSMIATDSGGAISFWNEGARRLYGFTASEMLGQPLTRLRSPADKHGGLTEAMMARALEDGKCEATIERVREDGRRVNARVVITPRRDSAGAPTGFLVVTTDITEEVTLAAELARAQAFTEAVLESAPDAMLIVNAAGGIEHGNAEAEKLFGYSREELIGRDAEMLVSDRLLDGDPVRRSGLFSEPRGRSGCAEHDLTGRSKDGIEFPVEVSLRAFQAEAGLATAAIRDVSVRKRAEQDLREANVEQLRVLNVELFAKLHELETATRAQRALHDNLRRAQRQTAESLTLLETLLSSAPVGFGFVDREFRIRRMNDMMAAVNGLPREEQVGRTVAEVVPTLWPKIEPVYRHVLETGEAVVNQEAHAAVPSAPGEGRHWLASYYPVRLKDEVIGVGLVVIDITEREQAEEMRAVVMENMAEGLYVMDEQGRFVFMNAAASRILGWSGYELMGKSVHAAIHYQHPDGSPFAEKDCQLLKVRNSGKTVRMANDAFTRKDGSIVPVAYTAGPLHSGTNVRGVVVAFRDTTEDQAERARAQREREGLAWVGRIRDALDEDRLVLYSQPIVPLSTRAKPSEELLVRMVGPQGEIIPPGSFLPAAEKYGQIGEIDHWVITQAARLAASGRRVHANLSGNSIGSLDLLPWIERQLSEAGADPANIVFEITETALMGDIEAGQALGRGIAELGCSLALDDFGTGYGSFTYLQKLKIAYLKIDIDFVRDLVSNTANQHLVKAIVNIAEGLGQQTIAEGVQDRETLELLRNYGVDFAQGFHLGRPQPLDVG